MSNNRFLNSMIKETILRRLFIYLSSEYKYVPQYILS